MLRDVVAVLIYILEACVCVCVPQEILYLDPRNRFKVEGTRRLNAQNHSLEAL